MNASDQVREYVKRSYLEPARSQGKAEVQIKTGDVHKSLRWEFNRFPIICQALETKKFLKDNNLELISKEGPPSGRSSTVVYTFRLRAQASVSSTITDVMSLRGLGKSWLRAAGGGEAYLRQEREGFSQAEPQ